jgi:predicted dehydrogenase
VLLVGLGAIGETHARALEATPSADVVAGVDVDGSRVLTFRGADRPVYRSLREAS